LKRIGKWLLKPIAAAIIICLVIAFLPQITSLVRHLFPSGDPIVTSQLIKSKMEEVGKLTVVEYTDSHTVEAHRSAIFFDAQRVSFPYDYKVALGIDLTKVSVAYTENQMIFTLPPIEVLYDELTVTGEIEKWDFLYHFTEKDYQKLLENEKASCKQGYLENQEIMSTAFNQAVNAMKSLFAVWLKDSHLTFGDIEIVFQSRPK